MSHPNFPKHSTSQYTRAFNSGVLTLLTLLTTLTLIPKPTLAAAPPTDRPPNILFILLDNVGKDWFRCYGSSENQTPNIDQLAYTGLKFRNFYITPVCSTSRTMLLTGRYPYTTGWHTHHDTAIYGGGFLDWNREITFARILRDAGYKTAISGKWQVNDLFDPAQKDALKLHGFDEHRLFPEGKPGHPAHKKRYHDPYIIDNGQRIDTTGKFGPDLIADYAIDYMTRNRDKPFLLFYPAILTHIPVTTTPLSPDPDATPREQFAGMLRYADHQIGRLVTALDDLNLRNNTIVIITTDNGTDNGTDQNKFQSLGGRVHGHVSEEGMYTLNELGINVPFIVNAPGLITRGGERDTLINAADILPTLADLAGAPLPKNTLIDGKSFAMTLTDNPTQNFNRPWTFTQYASDRIIRDQRFKLHSSGALYDLATDPLEKNNLVASPEPLTPEARAARNNLQATLDSLPPNATWPYTFRSISARKMRIQQDLPRRAKWIAPNRKPPKEIAPFFTPPAQYQNDFGPYRSPLTFADGSTVKTPDDWKRRRAEIINHWQNTMGPWPDLIENPAFERGPITRRGNITQRQFKLELGLGGEMTNAFMLVPDGDGPFPAVLTVYYDSQTGAGFGKEHRDFAYQLAQRGFVTLSIGKPHTGVNLDDPNNIPNRSARYYGPEDRPVSIQPLSALAYAAANAHNFLTTRPEVFPDRIGIVGHSFGGKWAIFASALYDKFACAVWSDPGIVFDERNRRKQNPGGSVNYWDLWYLGATPGMSADPNTNTRFRKLPTEGEPRTGAYKKLVENNHDLVELHALMAPRPFLVSGGTADLPERWPALNHTIALNKILGYDSRVAMTNRDTHAPTEESNQQIARFFEWWLMERE